MSWPKDAAEQEIEKQTVADLQAAAAKKLTAEPRGSNKLSIDVGSARAEPVEAAQQSPGQSPTPLPKPQRTRKKRLSTPDVRRGMLEAGSRAPATPDVPAPDAPDGWCEMAQPTAAEAAANTRRGRRRSMDPKDLTGECAQAVERHKAAVAAGLEHSAEAKWAAEAASKDDQPVAAEATDGEQKRPRMKPRSSIQVKPLEEWGDGAFADIAVHTEGGYSVTADATSNEDTLPNDRRAALPAAAEADANIRRGRRRSMDPKDLTGECAEAVERHKAAVAAGLEHSAEAKWAAEAASKDDQPAAAEATDDEQKITRMKPRSSEAIWSAEAAGQPRATEIARPDGEISVTVQDDDDTLTEPPKRRAGRKRRPSLPQTVIKPEATVAVAITETPDEEPFTGPKKPRRWKRRASQIHSWILPDAQTALIRKAVGRWQKDGVQDALVQWSHNAKSK